MDKVCEACKTIPPIVAEGYEEKGVYETVAEHKCYIAAPSPTPKTGVIFIFDIFGYFKQTLQGADILAFTVPGHVVVMPDFFHDEPMQISNFPPDTDEKKAKLGAFFQGPAHVQNTAQTVLKVLAALKEKYPTVEKWGVFGLCWGGKVATLVGSSGEVAATAQAHPAFSDATDAENLKTPHLCLASKDEPQDVMQKYIEILSSKNDGSYGKLYPENFHGWMGARANLKDDFERESFEKGYTEVVEFFKKHLG